MHGRAIPFLRSRKIGTGVWYVAKFYQQTSPLLPTKWEHILQILTCYMQFCYWWWTTYWSYKGWRQTLNWFISIITKILLFHNKIDKPMCTWHYIYYFKDLKYHIEIRIHLDAFHEINKEEKTWLILIQINYWRRTLKSCLF
jgi:hypothetical protein